MHPRDRRYAPLRRARWLAPSLLAATLAACTGLNQNYKPPADAGTDTASTTDGDIDATTAGADTSDTDTPATEGTSGAGSSTAAVGTSGTTSAPDEVERYGRWLTLSCPYVGETLEDVPILLHFESSELRHDGLKPDNDGFMFVPEGGVEPFLFELEDLGDNSRPTAIWLHVPELICGSPLKVWMEYGAALDEPFYKPEDVWTNMDTVLHFRNGDPVDASPTPAMSHTEGSASKGAGCVHEGIDFQGGRLLFDEPGQLDADAGYFSLHVRFADELPNADYQTLVHARSDTEHYMHLIAKKDPMQGDVIALVISSLDDLPLALHSEANTVTDGEWHHVAVNWEFGDYQLYLDGEAGSVAIPASPNLPNLDGPLTLGATYASEQPLFAEVDEFRVYPEMQAEDHAQLERDIIEQNEDFVLDHGSPEPL